MRFGKIRLWQSFARKFQQCPKIRFPRFHLNESSIPKCRFVQFTPYHCGNDKIQSHLGMVSEDGTKIIDLRDLTCAQSDLITLIEQGLTMQDLLKESEYLHIQTVGNHIRLLPPVVRPRNIFGVEENYIDTCREQHISVPKKPSFFMKSCSSLVGALDYIKLPTCAKNVDYENELAVVIGKKAKCVSCEDAMSYVFGYTIAQDITARRLRNYGRPESLSKSIDTFCPMGPAIVHKCHIPDPHNLWIRTLVNNEERQCSNTKNMIFHIDYLIHRLSLLVTLWPGDVILTGSPAGTGISYNPCKYLNHGDVIESQIQNLGKMRNRVVSSIRNENFE